MRALAVCTFIASAAAADSDLVRCGLGSTLVSLRPREDHGLLKERALARSFGLARIPNTDALLVQIEGSALVLVQDGWGYQLDHEEVGRFAPADDRWMFAALAPWTATFLTDLGMEFQAAFGLLSCEERGRIYAQGRCAKYRPLQIVSLVRPMDYQRLVQQARPRTAVGPEETLHATGAAIDISKLGMMPNQLVWMRGWLLAMERTGLVQAMEEGSRDNEPSPRGAFHIVVSPDYASCGNTQWQAGACHNSQP